MLYEVAIIPDVFSAELHAQNPALTSDLKALLRDLVHNGLVADLHKGGLSRHIYEEVKALPQKQRHLIMELLNTLHDRQRFVRHPRSTKEPTTAEAWLGLALLAHKHEAFHGIIVGQSLAEKYWLEDGHLLELGEVLDSAKWQERSTTLTVMQDEACYREALTPVLRYAKAVDLVDPYFSAGRRKGGAFVRLCAELLGQRRGGRVRGRVHIHASTGQFNIRRPNTISDWFDEWQELLEPLHKQYGHKFRVFLWEKPAEGQRFHDRFILTDQCGISVPAGFDFVRGSSTDWNFLDYDVARERREHFHQNSTVYKPVEGFQPSEIGF